MEHYYQSLKKVSTDGFFDYQELYTKVVGLLPTNSHIVEVGAWKGQSSAYLAVEIINSGKNIKLDVVDTWIGEGMLMDLWDAPDHDFVKHNGDFLPVFIKNIEPVKHVITPVRSTSASASQLYEDKSLDFVFIDANHSYESVSEDIKLWLPKIKDTGIMGGHDYNDGWPGVKKAINENFSKDKIQVIATSWLVQL